MISDECFAVPVSYRRLTRGRQAMADEEEELLQLAIQQSLLEGGVGRGEREERGRRESADSTGQEVREREGDNIEETVVSRIYLFCKNCLA